MCWGSLSGISLKMRFVVTIPLDRNFLPHRRVFVQPADHVWSALGFDMPIAVENGCAVMVQFQRPLPFFIHPYKTTPIRVAFLFQIPVAVAHCDHFGWSEDRSFFGFAPDRVSQINSQTGIGVASGKSAPHIVPIAHEEPSSGLQPKLVL